MPVYETALKAMAIGDEVVVIGPGTIDGAFTAEAAERSARALLKAAKTARRSAADAGRGPAPPDLAN